MLMEAVGRGPATWPPLVPDVFLSLERPARPRSQCKCPGRPGFPRAPGSGHSWTPGAAGLAAMAGRFLEVRVSVSAKSQSCQFGNQRKRKGGFKCNSGLNGWLL